MRVGINGMGRIGRLALRAAMGGLYRPADDPRAGNRLDVVQRSRMRMSPDLILSSRLGWASLALPSQLSRHSIPI
jgi:hypothetical protein